MEESLRRDYILLLTSMERACKARGGIALGPRFAQMRDTARDRPISNLPITSEEGMLANIRQCMDEPNGITLNDREWKSFLNGGLSPTGVLPHGGQAFARRAGRRARPAAFREHLMLDVARPLRLSGGNGTQPW